MLGRLATDEATRRRFRQAPGETLRELLSTGIELSPIELAALETLDVSAVQHFARSLDARLQRAVLSQAEAAPEE